MRLAKKPVLKTFYLESEFGKFSVTVRQARVGDDIRRAELMSTSSLVINDQLLGQEIKQKINQEEMKRFEVYLTLTDTDIEAEDEEGNGSPWFHFNNGRFNSQVDFELSYNLLPSEVAVLIHDKVREVNPHWKPTGKDDEEGE